MRTEHRWKEGQEGKEKQKERGKRREENVEKGMAKCNAGIYCLASPSQLKNQKQH